MKAETLPVLYEDNHLLIVNKPPLLATMGAAEGLPTAVNLSKDYLKKKYQKPGNVFLGVVSRLDSFVSGALPFARTSKAAQRLTASFAEHRVDKRYLAVVPGEFASTQDHWVDWIQKNDRRKRMEIVAPRAKGSQEARLDYQVLARWKGLTLLKIQLETGRKHQIRVQLADRGFPILGDRKYGGAAIAQPGIFLHCYRLQVPHPTQVRNVEVTAELPVHWHRRFQQIDATLKELEP